LRAAANMHLIAVDRGAKIGECALEDDGPVDLAVSVRKKQPLHRGVGIEDAWLFAAAVETQVERVERSNGASVEHLGAPCPQVFFAPPQKRLGDVGLVWTGPHYHHRGHSQIGGQRTLILGWAEAAMDEALQFTVAVDRQPQSLPVEVRLVENELLEFRCRQRLDQRSAICAAPPQFGHKRRISIAKRSIVDQGAYPQATMLVDFPILRRWCEVSLLHHDSKTNKRITRRRVQFASVSWGKRDDSSC
jgi:hypothetical protein